MSYDPLKIEARHRRALGAEQRFSLWRESAELKRQKRITDAIDILKSLYVSTFCMNSENMDATVPGEDAGYFVHDFDIGKRLAYYLQLEGQFDAAWCVYDTLTTYFGLDYFWRQKIEVERAKMLKKEKRLDHATLHFALSYVFEAWCLADRLAGISRTTRAFNEAISHTQIRIRRDEDDCMYGSWTKSLADHKQPESFAMALKTFLAKKCPDNIYPITECVIAITTNRTRVPEDHVIRSIDGSIRKTQLFKASV